MPDKPSRGHDLPQELPPRLIRLQAFNPDGSVRGPEILIDSAAGDLVHPAIAALAGGGLVVAREEAAGFGIAPLLVLRALVFNAGGSAWEPSPPIAAETAED